MGLDGFSLYASAYELNSALRGGRIDKICQPRKSDIYISVRLPGVTRILHASIDPRLASAAVTENQPENPLEPPTFCMLLRKQLEGGRIAGVNQLGMDRVLVVEIDVLGAGAVLVTKKLYIELMGKYSNIILVENDLIIDSLRRVGINSSRVRTVLPQQKYLPPPLQDCINILESADEFLDRVKKLKECSIYKAVLTVGAGFGPVTAKEILFSAGLPSDISVNDLYDSDFASLKTAVNEAAAVYHEKAFTPTLIKNANNKIIAMAAFPLHIFPNDEALSFSSMSQLTETAHKMADDYVSPEKDQLVKIVMNELSRQENKKEKLMNELQHAQNAAEQKRKADNIMTYQYQFKDHQDAHITVADIYDENNAPITIDMDKKLTVIQNMQKYYNKYDKLRRAEKVLAEQLKECSDSIEYLATIEASLDSSRTLPELADIKAELIKSGYMQTEKRRRMAIPSSKPFKYTLGDDITILVGKNNFQNDKLTLKTANADDIWLHTKNIPGSHVIIRTEGAEPDIKIIEQAAAIAAYYSKARNSSKVPVDYTYCRFVKKPSGAKPGYVIFTNNKTLYVTPSEENMKEILKNNG